MTESMATSDDAAELCAPQGDTGDLARWLDELEQAIIAKRDDAGVPGRVSERKNVQQIVPDDQAPS